MEPEFTADPMAVAREADYGNQTALWQFKVFRDGKYWHDVIIETRLTATAATAVHQLEAHFGDFQWMTDSIA